MNDILKQINQVLEKHLKNIKYKSFLYGSRARGDFFFRSDYDIGIIPKQEISSITKNDILEDFEKIPALIDFTDFSKVDENFKKLAMKEIIWIKK